jgi:hypothetical protein
VNLMVDPTCYGQPEKAAKIEIILPPNGVGKHAPQPDRIVASRRRPAPLWLHVARHSAGCRQRQRAGFLQRCASRRRIPDVPDRAVLLPGRQPESGTGQNETVEGRACTTLVAVRRPGHGLSAEDRYLLFIDAENHLLRRVRFTIGGLESTQGAIAEVDFFEHTEIAGVTWPTRFFERLRKPIPNLPVHDWRLIGLDVNRGLIAADIAGPTFSAKASAPARPIN